MHSSKHIEHSIVTGRLIVAKCFNSTAIVHITKVFCSMTTKQRGRSHKTLTKALSAIVVYEGAEETGSLLGRQPTQCFNPVFDNTLPDIQTQSLNARPLRVRHGPAVLCDKPPYASVCGQK